MSTFPQWLAAVAQAFGAWVEAWMAENLAAFRAPFREVSTHSRATMYGTMVCDSEGRNEPCLILFVGVLAVGSVMGWPGEVLPVFQELLCSLPTLAVPTVLEMEENCTYLVASWQCSCHYQTGMTVCQHQPSSHWILFIWSRWWRPSQVGNVR